MFGLRLSKQSSSVGIEIKEHVIRFVELQSKNPLVVKQMGERLIPEGLIENGEISDLTQFKLIIEDCIDTWKLKKKKITFSVSDELVVVKKITTPIDLHPEELRGYLYLELGESIHLPFEDPSIDYVILKETNEGRELLLIATPEQTVLAISSIFEEAKVDPIAADISPLCFDRLHYHVATDRQNETSLLVQLDVSSTTISLFEERVPVFMQCEPTSIILSQFDELSEAWKQRGSDIMNGFDLVIGMIERILHFYRFTLSEGNECKNIKLVGDHPFLTTFFDMLNEQIDLPTELDSHTIKDIGGELVPMKYQLAIGLSLKEVLA
ncbi:type IV pilus biogenesis protein PilM [Bacillus sp. AFS017336]|uniref:type IV pilus biogenesis protein PilM n=1 Tax=Bacillus sp. AFS017336 TaxID=2033489 RepID=UPI000BF1816B|nr:pilus assembly protein PilM [Bacillus sp. AFS017336]PEL13435.1 hypothetical protein CN601_04650 [Bacillus sp. AFS017336]